MPTALLYLTFMSIEKDFHAHQTLSLRALFRHFAKGKAPDCYYDYVKKGISRDTLFAHPKAKDELLALEAV